MQFGFYLPNNGPTARPDPLAEIARRGDALGYHCMVVGDQSAATPYRCPATLLQ